MPIRISERYKSYEGETCRLLVGYLYYKVTNGELRVQERTHPFDLDHGLEIFHYTASLSRFIYVTQEEYDWITSHPRASSPSNAKPM